MTMKRPMAAMAYLIGSAVVVYAQTPELRSYRYPADGFQVSFPAEPKITNSKESTQSGYPVTRMYSNELPAGAYFVAVTDCGQAAAAADPDVLLQAGKTSSLVSMNGRLVSEQKINLSIVPGLAFETEGDGNHYQTRLYMAGSILYQVIVGYTIGNKPADADRFLDSFGLITRTVH